MNPSLYFPIAICVFLILCIVLGISNVKLRNTKHKFLIGDNLFGIFLSIMVSLLWIFTIPVLILFSTGMGIVYGIKRIGIFLGKDKSLEK